MKVEAHRRYSNSREDLPGVTTVLNVLDKPGLPKWANNLGLQGIDSNRFLSETAEIGSLTHEMVLAYFSKKPYDASDYSTNQVKKAKKALTLFHKWVEVYNPKPILVEKPLVSHRFGYGGTIDLYATLTIGGQVFHELCDFKTGSGPWPTHFAQLAAYQNLLLENGYFCDNCRLVRIPADFEENSFSESQLLSLDKYWTLFLHCLAIYKMKLL